MNFTEQAEQEIKILKIGKVNAFRESLCILHVVEIKIYDVVLRYVKTQNLHNLSCIEKGSWVMKVQIDNGWCFGERWISSTELFYYMNLNKFPPSIQHFPFQTSCAHFISKTCLVEFILPMCAWLWRHPLSMDSLSRSHISVKHWLFFCRSHQSLGSNF